MLILSATCCQFYLYIYSLYCWICGQIVDMATWLSKKGFSNHGQTLFYVADVLEIGPSEIISWMTLSKLFLIQVMKYSPFFWYKSNNWSVVVRLIKLCQHFVNIFLAIKTYVYIQIPIQHFTKLNSSTSSEEEKY